MAVTRTLETTGDAGELFIGFSIDVVLALINFPEKSHANSSFTSTPTTTVIPHEYPHRHCHPSHHPHRHQLLILNPPPSFTQDDDDDDDDGTETFSSYASRPRVCVREGMLTLQNVTNTNLSEKGWGCAKQVRACDA